MNMRNRLGYAIVVTLLGTSAFLSACNDDDDGLDETNGGESAGGEPSAGGSSAGRAGSTGGGGRAGAGGSAGSSMGGDTTDAGAGGMSEAGGGGDGGMGGAAAGMGGANVGGAEGGAAGAGGADPVTYSCTANSINHKLCSAFAAAECGTTEACPDCVARVQEERSFFAECATCLAEFDKFYQCAIDGYEAGDVSMGVQCFEGAAEPAEACYPLLDVAWECQDYIAVEDCPATWPVE
jgi:hypothetical protein